jgi:hypothetical protein
VKYWIDTEFIEKACQGIPPIFRRRIGPVQSGAGIRSFVHKKQPAAWCGGGRAQAAGITHGFCKGTVLARKPRRKSSGFGRNSARRGACNAQSAQDLYLGAMMPPITMTSWSFARPSRSITGESDHSGAPLLR